METDSTDRSVGVVVLRLADVHPVCGSRPVRDEVGEGVCRVAVVSTWEQ